MLLLVFASGLGPDWLVLNLLGGAFLLAAIMSKEHKFVHYVLDGFETITHAARHFSHSPGRAPI